MSGQMPARQASSPTLAQRFAAVVAGVQLADLPPPAIQAVRTFTLDTIGVGLAGARSAYAPGVARAAAGWGEGAAASVFATGQRLPPASAAMVNAFQAHALEFDCVHEAAVLHPFTVVIPVLLAEAERRMHQEATRQDAAQDGHASGGTPLDGATFVAAAAAGVEMAASLGAAALSQIRFFRPATCGLFGATAALARARGLDADGVAHALGYALAFASGTMQAHVEGTPALAASVGAAARSAFAAVDLVQAGLPGPLGSLDGPFGYLGLFEQEVDATRIEARFGRDWRVCEVSHKPFPTGRAAHGGIDMILALARQGLTPRNLDRLVIEAPPLIHHLVGRPIAPAPLEVNYARLCLPWAGAVALLTGGVGLEDFGRERLDDPQVHALAARIEVRVNPAITDQAAFVPQRARAILTDGRVLETAVDALLGSPARPLSRDAHLAKFAACARFGLGAGGAGAVEARVGALVEACHRLESLPDTAILARLASGAAP
jgi:2-methylcitrate dehydratase PrpD